ncbi:MAG: cytochrome d ubiquinol oxidase subunit II [Haloferacaceae archaeon]
MTEAVALVSLSEPLFGLPLAELWFGLTFLVLGAFLLLDGFDFGVGVLFPTRDDEREREQLLAAIGPFWDGNEVWLVVFGGALFATFPAVYATLFSRNYLLMFAILGALIVRGLAPEMYEQRDDPAWHRVWGVAFTAGSAAAPFLLGVFVGNWLTGTGGLSPASVVVGLAVVALSVVSGAAFLGIKTREALQSDMRRVGPRAVAAYLALVVAALLLLSTRPHLREGLLGAGALVPVGLSVVFAGGYAYAAREGRFRAAFAATAGLVLSLVALVASLLYPVVDPGTGLSVSEAVVSTVPLNVMTLFAAPLLPLVVVYFVVLYTSFSGPVEAGETY